MSTSPRRRPGAPLGNVNHFKHGFYSRRLKKRDLTGVEETDSHDLVQELALIRVFTRRLIESFDPKAGFYENADVLRILCIASDSITRVIRTQCLVAATGLDRHSDLISQAIREVNEELSSKMLPDQSPTGDPSPLIPNPQETD